MPGTSADRSPAPAAPVRLALPAPLQVGLEVVSHLTPESCRRSHEGEPALPGAPGLSAASAPRQGQKPHFLLIATDRLSSTRRARANLRAAPRRRPSPGCAVKGHRVPDCPALPSSPSKRSHETVLWSVHSRPPETAMSAGPGVAGLQNMQGCDLRPHHALLLTASRPRGPEGAWKRPPPPPLQERGCRPDAGKDHVLPFRVSCKVCAKLARRWLSP